MRSTMVYLSDFVSATRQCLYFDEEDYAKMDAHWDEDDARLLTYQAIPAFKGLTRYSQLSTEHLRVLIDFVLSYYDDMTEEDKQNNTHPVTQMLHFVLLALAKTISLSIQSKTEIIRLNRVSKRNITFEVSSFLDMSFKEPQGASAQQENPFAVVLDNRE